MTLSYFKRKYRTKQINNSRLSGGGMECVKMAFTATDVKNLREMTGCGMMDCKRALTEADGDVDKAIELLREKGLAAAAKKAGRIAAEGIVEAMVGEDGKLGVMVEVNSETDFVAKNADFQTFVKNVATQIAKKAPCCVDGEGDCLLKQKFYADESVTIGDMLTEKIATIGENINIRRFDRREGICEAYIHGGGRIGVLVEFTLADESKKMDAEFRAYAKDIAMQVAAANPLFLDESSVPEETIAKEKEILMAQALNEGKPQNIAEKMVNGRIAKYFKEVCLVDQLFIKDGDLTVAQLTKQVSEKIGTEITIVGFTRFEKGEGIEKRNDNFADEVASMMK